MVKNKIIFIAMAVVIVMNLSGCTKTKTVSYTDENGNTTTTTTTTDNGETTTVTENIDSEGNVTSHEEEESASDIDSSIQEPEYSVIESDDGYKVTFNPEYFVLEEGGEYEGSDSTYIRCIIDEENTYENFIDVGVIQDYNAKDLIDGIALTNDTEAISMHMVLANGEYDCYYCEKHVTDTFIISFYAIDGKTAPYLIQVGSHIYSDDDEYAYYVSGIMEETFLDLEFDK